jgi:hypothetical protein
MPTKRGIMPHRASWLKLLASFLAVAIFVLGAAVPAAHAKKPPKNTQLPNGRPFQIIQGMFNDVDERLDKLEANAPKAGTMWINPLDLTPGLSTTTLSAAPFPTPGLIVSAGVADVLQVGLQVPLGFAIAGARVCYTPVAAASVSSVTLTKNNATPPFGSIPSGRHLGQSGRHA